MDGVIILVLFLLAIPVGLAIWLIVRAVSASNRISEMEIDLRKLRSELRELRRQSGGPTPAASPVSPPTPSQPAAVTPPSPALPATPPTPLAEPVRPSPAPPLLPPVLPSTTPTAAPTAAPKLPAVVAPPRPPTPVIDWEKFMGVKMFAWVGGLALFLGLAFFVKYSFENNWITPEMRVAIGFVTGAGLLVGGLVMTRRDYEVLGQTLCATGSLVLYATTFGAHAFYHLIGVTPAFALMILVTVTAFLLAVKLDAQVVAVLGLLGGFLTPILLSTGQDRPLGLFGYIGLLDAGLIAVVARKRWNYLVLLAAVGTALMQLAWVDKFFTVTPVDKTYTAMGIFLSMEALFLAGFVLAQKRDETNKWITAGAALLAAAPLVFALDLLTFPSVGARPGVLFTFVLVADLGLLTLATLRAPLWPAHLAAGGAVFLTLTIWTFSHLTNALLNWALGFYLLFAILHSVYPVVLQRLRPCLAPLWWGHLFPVLALLLVMIPICRLPELGFAVWLCVLVLDVIVFGLALITASVFAIIGALLLTVVATALWILKIPAELTGVPDLLVVIGGFALVFFVLGIFATRKIAESEGSYTALIVGVYKAGKDSPPFGFLNFGSLQANVPSLSAILPFLLLVMVVLRLPLENPSTVFGLAMLLVVLLLGVAKATNVDWLVAIGLLCSLGLEYAWHGARFKPEFAVVPLGWYLAFYAVFTIFPFLFRRTFENRIVPWAVAALAGPLHFRLVYHLADSAFRNPYMGLLPAAFVIPPLIALIYLIRAVSADNKIRMSQLAWFGGSTLFFITLIFPIQFEKQWITIGWALEGVALLWLFHRVPHAGMRLVGTALLVVAFGRLALNPAVLEYHARSGTPIWNWYLYGYGITTVCLMVGAWLLSPPRNMIQQLNAPPLLYALGTVLAFLLVNIEIADYFSSGSSLTFQFSGNFARDMTYSIAWALFAITLLIVGITKRQPAVRYCSIGLLGVTVLKLFLHDLSNLSELYRIGAFMGVAVVALVSAFLYKRFFISESKSP